MSRVYRLGFGEYMPGGTTRNRLLVLALNEMAESFANKFTVVEVTTDGPSQNTEVWIALANSSQALTLLLAAVSEGWTAEVLKVALTIEQQRTFEKLKLKPGDVHRLTK